MSECPHPYPEFARRDGCDEKLVRRAIAEGRLPRDADGLVDAALVGTPWRRSNLDRVRTGADTQAEVRTLPDVRDSAPAPEAASDTSRGVESQ